MIQLTHRGLVVSRPDALDDLADTFARVHCVLLRGFLEPAILDWLASAIERATFVPRVHDEIDPPATDLWLSDPSIRGTLLFLFNDPSLFDFIRRLSGCGPIGCFIGSTYRMMAEMAHADSWHDDVWEGRMIALSLNLSPQGYRGGLLQIREQESQTVVHEVANTGFGDAIVFRLSPAIEHRVTDVLPGPAKTAYAGWFKAHPSRATFILPA
jgi:hypothetical protein